MRWRNPDSTVLLAYAAFVLIGLSTGVGGVLLLAQLEDYEVSRATIGITFFTGSAGFMLGSSTTAALIARIGVRGVAVTGGLLFTAVAFYTASRPPFAAFVAVGVISGYAIGLLESILNVYLAGLPESTTRLNRLHAFFGVGALIGPALATWMLGFTTWPAVWLVLGIVCLPLIFGFFLRYPASRRPAAAEAAQDRPNRAVLRQPAVLLGAVLLAVYVGLEFSMGSWGFSYLVETRGQPELLAGYSVSGYWFGLTLGRFVLSPIAMRLGMSTPGLMTTCVTGVAVLAAFVWLVPSGLAASLGFALLGFFLGPVFPTTMAVTPLLTAPPLVPAAIGMLNAGSVIGGSVLPWLAGALGQSGGVWTLMPYVLLLALLQVAAWWSMARRIGRPVST